MNDPIDPVVVSAWLVGDVLEQALWVEALLAINQQQPAFLDDHVTELATRWLRRWPARAQG